MGSRYFWTVKIREQSIPRNSLNEVTLILRRCTTVNVPVRVTVHTCSHFLNIKNTNVTVTHIHMVLSTLYCFGVVVTFGGTVTFGGVVTFGGAATFGSY